MRKIPYAILFFIIVFLTHDGAGKDWNNWVRTLEPLSEVTQLPDSLDIASNGCRVTVQYFDGLNRPKATIRKAFTRTGNDVADFIDYDNRGFMWRRWLPITSIQAQDEMSLDEFANRATNIMRDDYPFTESLYDDMGRMTELINPGENWRSAKANHSMRHRYLFNNSNVYIDEEEDVMFDVSCNYYYVGNGGELRVHGEYANSQLRVDLSIDEDGRYIAYFTDKSNRTLLVRRYIDGNSWESADTYWVYDSYGRLRYIIPPMAVKAFHSANNTGQDHAVTLPVVEKLCFRYDYDERDQCVVKKFPGMTERYYVYDRLNRPVMSQNGEQRKSGEWTITKYDHQQRPAIVGRVDLPSVTRTTLQSQWGDSILLAEFVPGHDMEHDLGYVQLSGPLITVDKALYYDNHDFWTSLLPITGMSMHMDSLPQRGLQTGYAITDYSGNVTVMAICSDRNGRVTIEAERDLYAQHHAIFTYMNYDFSGRLVSKRRTTAQVVEQVALNRHDEQWKYEYDNWDRLKNVRYKPGTQGWQTLAEYAYNSQGKLTKSQLGGNENITVHYNYNIRGWLVSQTGHINQIFGYETSLFGLEDNMNGATVTPRWGGDISCMMTTRVKPTGTTFGYRTFDYDNLGRLSQVHDTDNARFHESYTYDENGNVTNIVHGWPLRYDNIAITYDGNHISTITEASDFDNMLGEMPQLTQGVWEDAVGYDDDGRIVHDNTRGITKVLYNPLGLPTQVRMGENTLVMRYRADGIKDMQQTIRSYLVPVKRYDATTGDTVTVCRKKAEIITQLYIGDMVIQAGKPDRIYNNVGYTEWHIGHDGTDSVAFHYYERDHWGSILAVLDAEGNIEEATDYLANGIPSTALGVTVDDHRHNGKQWVGFAGLGWHDYRTRWHDALLMHFITPDPFVEKYPDISPYAFCANNPIRYLDPSGSYLVDHQGRKISYDNGKWSQRTPDDTKQFAEAMQNNSEGKKIFKTMLTCDYPIELCIDTQTENGKLGMSDIETKIIRRKSSQDKIRVFAKVKMTLFSKTIEQATEIDAMYKDSGLTTDDIMGTVATHEGLHSTDTSACSQFSDVTKEDAEQKALEVEQKAIQEIQKKRKAEQDRENTQPN